MNCLFCTLKGLKTECLYFELKHDQINDQSNYQREVIVFYVVLRSIAFVNNGNALSSAILGHNRLHIYSHDVFIV